MKQEAPVNAVDWHHFEKVLVQPSRTTGPPNNGKCSAPRENKIVVFDAEVIR
jgi:hypothetical protein